MSGIDVPRPLARLAVVMAVAVAVPLTACSTTGDPGGGGPAVEVETVADGLTIPWDVVRDPQGVIVTGERGSGTLHAIRAGGERTVVEADVGEVYDRGETA